MNLKVHIVSAFTYMDEGGSAVGVVLNAYGLSDSQMRKVAANLPVSHTAFVFETTNENETIKIRFFTRSGEIASCIHGSIAANYLRAKHSGFKYNKLVFQELKEGKQSVEVVKRNVDYGVYVLQKETVFSDVSRAMTEELLEALNLSDDDLAENFKVINASPGSNRFLIGLKSDDCVYGAKPDFEKLKHVCFTYNSIGCLIYAVKKSEKKIRAVARMFSPNIGVNEDVVNGDSSGCLGAYLLKLNPADSLDLCVGQGQKFNRDGIVKVKVRNIGGRFETVIGGSAKTEREMMINI
ncbi:MAG: hypothetical protein K0S32_2253 [Bacteroidetes bacterium]|jgi:PhzF family phenazine biosynthesis protein|nr:hypothetical protein [Bacteroidota bacterium]